MLLGKGEQRGTQRCQRLSLHEQGEPQPRTKFPSKWLRVFWAALRGLFLVIPLLCNSGAEPWVAHLERHQRAAGARGPLS